MLNKKDTVCAALLRELTGGTLPPGEFIPSRNQLMRRFHCSRTVIERAVAELTNLGYLSGRQGKGTIVTSPENAPGKIRKINVVSPYEAKSFRSPFSCLLLDAADLTMPIETIASDRADGECETLCLLDSVSVFINPGFEQLPLMNYLKSRRIPLIVINREFNGFNRICTDVISGFKEGLKLLMTADDSRLSLISRTPSLNYPYQEQRLRCFYQVCAEYNLNVSPDSTLTAPFTEPQNDIAAAGKLFRNLPARICVLNSDLLLPLLQYAQNLRLQPGRDFQLLAFEYSANAAGIPGITMIRQRYDLFYQELLRFLDLCQKPGFKEFISVIPPEVIIN